MINSKMSGKNDIQTQFSWIPPPSTVVTIRRKTKISQKSKNSEISKHNGEVANEEKIEHSKARFQSRNSYFRNENHLKEKDSYSCNGDGSSIDSQQEFQGERCKSSSEKQDEPVELIFEEAIQPQSVQVAESRMDFFIEEQSESNSITEDYSNGSWLSEVPSRKESSSEYYQIGKEVVNVGDMMKSRKKSEYNPSQKFLSLSFQNSGDSDEKGFTENIHEPQGAVHLKRLDPDKLEKSEQRCNLKDCDGQHKAVNEKKMKKLGKGGEEKQRNDLKRKKAEINNELIIEKDIVQKNDLEGHETSSSRKKSTFLQEDISIEPIDVQEILNRKKSTASFREKFLSMSFENNDNEENGEVNLESPRASRGGLYAKRISSKK